MSVRGPLVMWTIGRLILALLTTWTNPQKSYQTDCRSSGIAVSWAATPVLPKWLYSWSTVLFRRTQFRQKQRIVVSPYFSIVFANFHCLKIVLTAFVAVRIKWHLWPRLNLCSASKWNYKYIVRLIDIKHGVAIKLLGLCTNTIVYYLFPFLIILHNAARSFHWLYTL